MRGNVAHEQKREASGALRFTDVFHRQRALGVGVRLDAPMYAVKR